MSEVSKLGRRIKFLREQRGLSVNELAKLANVARPGLSLLERGRQQGLHSDALARIARTLGVSTDSLLFDDPLEGLESCHGEETKGLATSKK